MHPGRAVHLPAFSAEYIAGILGARTRYASEPAALKLTRRAVLLQLQMPDFVDLRRPQGLDDAGAS